MLLAGDEVSGSASVADLDGGQEYVAPAGEVAKIFTPRTVEGQDSPRARADRDVRAIDEQVPRHQSEQGPGPADGACPIAAIGVVHPQHASARPQAELQAAIGSGNHQASFSLNV